MWVGNKPENHSSCPQSCIQSPYPLMLTEGGMVNIQIKPIFVYLLLKHTVLFTYLFLKHAILNELFFVCCSDLLILVRKGLEIEMDFEMSGCSE